MPYDLKWIRVLVEYKNNNNKQWLEGLPMKHNPVLASGFSEYTQRRTDKADYRGSLVNLTPNTTYDIRLALENTSRACASMGFSISGFGYYI